MKSKNINDKKKCNFSLSFNYTAKLNHDNQISNYKYNAISDIL